MLRFTSSCVAVVSAMFLTAGCQPSVGTPPPEAPGTTAAVVEPAEGGYLRELMELTPDMSLIKLPADSTTLAIRFDQECVLAQWGADWYASSVEPVVAGGRCLLGETVSLD